MRHLGLALGISFVAALAVFGISYPILNDAHVAEGLAAIPIVGCHQIAELLEQSEGKKSFAPGQYALIRSLDGFSLSWPLSCVYGALVLIAVVQAFAGLSGLILGVFVRDQTLALRAILLISLPVQIAAAYFVGRWIGARSKDHGILAIVLTTLVSSIVAHAIDTLFSSSADFAAMFGTEKSMARFVTQVTASFVLQLIPALLGYWRGTRRRLAKYLQYLLAILPADTKAALIDLAFQEASRVRLKKA